LSAARGVASIAVTEALPFGHGLALFLELGELRAPLRARCDLVRVLVEIVDVRAHHLDRPHAGGSDPVREEVSGEKADSDENGVDNCSLGRMRTCIYEGRRFVCGDRSGRTSAPISPHAVQTILPHMKRTGIPKLPQFFFSTSLCTLLPISIRRRQIFSRNEITLSTSASLGSFSFGSPGFAPSKIAF
jgi:hypothetical protein